MIAGDQSRRSYDPKDVNHRAISYACYGGGGFSGTDKEAPGMPGYGNKTIGCSAIRLQIFFPSCWNGKDLDTADHRSHMAYPIGDISQGDCPATHPYRVPGLFFEAFYNTNLYPHGDGKIEWPFVLSQSDLTGYGMHGDFVSGWDEDYLHRALHDTTCQCGNVDCCDTFKPFHQGAGAPCGLDKPIGFFEDIGMTTPITKLPGCNKMQGVGANAPSCPTPSAALTNASTGVHRVFLTSNAKNVLTPPWNEPWEKITATRKYIDLENVWAVRPINGQRNTFAFQNLYSMGWLVHWTGESVFSMQNNVKDVQQNNWYWWTTVPQNNSLTAIKSLKDSSWLSYDASGFVTAKNVAKLTSEQLWTYSDQTRWNGKPF